MKYRIEAFYLGRWCKIADYVTHQFAQGVLWGIKENSPQLAYRVVRNEDEKVTDELAAKDDVSVGMIAGFPTAEQYELAAEMALARAKSIREKQATENHLKR